LQDFPYAAESDREVLDESFETTGGSSDGHTKTQHWRGGIGGYPSLPHDVREWVRIWMSCTDYE